nr:hypothetical protein [Mobiluncus sp. Marseille-Q7826]
MKRRELLNRLEQIAKERGESFTLVEGDNHTKAFIGPQMIAVPDIARCPNQPLKPS